MSRALRVPAVNRARGCSGVWRNLSRQCPFWALLFCVAAEGGGGKEECEAGQECGAAGQLWGTDVLIDAHTVVLAEGTEAEVRAPGFNQRFPLTFVDQGDSCGVLGWKLRAKRRRVWDAFTFFNELLVLEVRLSTLDEVVDTFVIAEATKTHSNQAKSLLLTDVFRDPTHPLHRFAGKVRVVEVADLPESTDAWHLEEFQRNALSRGLSNAADEDVVIVSDADEIPSPSSIRALAECDGWGEDGPVHFYTRFYNFRFGWIFDALWHHPQAATGAWLRPRGPQQLRMSRTRPDFLRLDDAGWHLSFFADAEGVLEKMKAYAHQEFNRDDMLNRSAIQHAIESGVDYFYKIGKGEKRFGELHENPSCQGLPAHVTSHPDRFAHWLPPECIDTNAES